MGVHHDPEGPVVVLSPHLDDAVLSAWSVLTGPDRVVVVNVFDGVPPEGTTTRFDRLCRAPDSAAQVRARLEEDRAALARAGHEPVGLGLLDGQYVDAVPDAGSVLAALDGRVPAACAVLAPCGIGGHGDHVAVRDAAIRLAADHAIPAVLYAELPYAIKWGWPEWVTGAEPQPGLDAGQFFDWTLDRVRWPRERISARVHRLDPAAQAAKRRAIETYATQQPSLDQGPHGLLRKPEILGFEVSWALLRPPA